MTEAIIRGVLVFGGMGMLLGFLNQCSFKDGFHLQPGIQKVLLKGAIYGTLAGMIVGILGYNLR